MKGTKGFPATLAIAKQTLRRTSLSRETRLQAITDAVSRFASTHLRDKETQEEAIIAIEEVIAEALANNLTLESIKASLNKACDTWYLGSNWAHDSRVGKLTPLMAAAKEGNSEIAEHLITKYQVRVDAGYDKKWLFGTWNTLDCATLYGGQNEGLITYLSQQAIQQYIGLHATIDTHNRQYHQIWDLSNQLLSRGTFSRQRAKYLAQALKRDKNILKLTLPAHLPLLPVDQVILFQEALLRNNSIKFLKISTANHPRNASREMSDAMGKLLEIVLKSNTALLQIDLTECDLSRLQLIYLIQVFADSESNTTLQSILFSSKSITTLLGFFTDPLALSSYPGLKQLMQVVPDSGPNMMLRSKLFNKWIKEHRVGPAENPPERSAVIAAISKAPMPIDERDYIKPQSFHDELDSFKQLLSGIQLSTSVEREATSRLKNNISQYLADKAEDITACDRSEDITRCLAERCDVLKDLAEKLTVLYVGSVERWEAGEQRPWLQLQEEVQSILRANEARLEKIYSRPEDAQLPLNEKEAALRIFRRSFKRRMGALHDAASVIASGVIASKKQSGVEHVTHLTVAVLSTMPPVAALLHLAGAMKHVPAIMEILKEALHLTHHAAHATAAVTPTHHVTDSATNRVVHFFGSRTEYEKSKNFSNCFGGPKSADTKIPTLAHFILHHYETQLNDMLKRTHYASSAAVLIGEFTATHIVTLFMSGALSQDGPTNGLMEAAIHWLSYAPFLETLILKDKQGELINVGEYYAKSGIRFVDSRKNSEGVLDSQHIYHCNATLSEEKQGVLVNLSKNKAIYQSRWATSQELRWLEADWNQIAPPAANTTSPILKKRSLHFERAVLRGIKKEWLPLVTKPFAYLTQGKRIAAHEQRLGVMEARQVTLEQKQEADVVSTNEIIAQLKGKVKAGKISHKALKAAFTAEQIKSTLLADRIAALEEHCGIQPNQEATQAAPTDRPQEPPTNQAPLITPEQPRSVPLRAPVADNSFALFNQANADAEPPIAHVAPDLQEAAASTEGGVKQMRVMP